MPEMKSNRSNQKKCVAFSLLVFITLIMDSGCQKVIDVDLNVASPQIVIEGLITDDKGPYFVTISKSGSYFDQPIWPHVSGAEVVITDNTGIIDTLVEINPGIYITTKTRGVPGRTYTLKVKSENKEYTASSTIKKKVPIDTMALVKDQTFHIDFGGGPDEREHIELHCIFLDPQEKNFYRIKVFINDTTKTDIYRLYDDQYTNGEYTELRVAHAKAGDTDLVELFSLDSPTYQYYRSLETILHTNPVFGSTPANPVTNLDNGALGYFGACAVSRKTIIITQSMIDNVK
jgi:hypothetical protein